MRLEVGAGRLRPHPLVRCVGAADFLRRPTAGHPLTRVAHRLATPTRPLATGSPAWPHHGCEERPPTQAPPPAAVAGYEGHRPTQRSSTATD